MPALSSASLLHSLVVRNATTDAASNGVQVICAWPVSGQYGPGSRVLYYVLVAACVFARKADWLRNACLAAALLFPAVAAIHGIVLAALHIDGAVDMDVYGAFQLCSIGILAAPVTVRHSQTYFNDPGRNTIFVWTVLILAGLLSLTVEFFRIKTFPCPLDDSGSPVPSDASRFPYPSLCGLTCSVDDGPFSPMRGGSANNIYVIPAPDSLTFGTATLVAAACCIPAILSLISMWNKILEINWKSRFSNREDDEAIDEPIAGTNGATIQRMRGVNETIRFLLSAVELPVFGAAILAILIIGERNFFSSQVSHQTEPIASIGQWAPIIGTGLALLGSLYLLLVREPQEVKEKTTPNTCNHDCNCSMQAGRDPSAASSHSMTTPAAADMHRILSNDDRQTSTEIVPTTSAPSVGHSHQSSPSVTGDIGNRRKVTQALTSIGNYLGTAAPDRFDDSEFKRGRAVDFPEIPGEENRNPTLPQIREQYNQSRGSDGNVTPGLRRQRSRASSFNGSIASGFGVEVDSASPRVPSPHSPRSSTLPTERTSFDLQNMGVMTRQRRDTLEVPSTVHHSSTRNNSSAPPVNSLVTVTSGPSSPAIVISSDPETYSPTDTPPPTTPISASHPSS